MYRQECKKWLESPVVDEATKKELHTLDNDELKDRFSGMLTFGTAGLRGILGAGLNRMNIYTVRYATQGVAELICAEGADACRKGVVIGYDCRHMSREFADEVCSVLAANGIRSFIFDELRPTPEISFAVLELGCSAGIMITASHNPKEYNGYKCYWSDGIQISLDQAKIVSAAIERTDIFDDVKVACAETTAEYVTTVGKDFDEKYINAVLSQVIDKDVIASNGDMKIMYTPFHGAGYRLVPETLRRAGFTDIVPVEDQMTLDGDFPTVKSPNPENREGFEIAIKKAKTSGCGLIIGTDPDSDRVGIVVKDKNNQYVALTGNQTGAILTEYILGAKKRNGTLPADGFIVRTIVTSELVDRICESYGVKVTEVLTGFKFIGEKLADALENKDSTYILGFEESYGYLIGDYTRDKDGVSASLMICEAAAYYGSRGMTLCDALEEIFAKYGYYNERTVNIFMEGLDGGKRMSALMNSIRKDTPKALGGLEVIKFSDYKKGVGGLPSSDVLGFRLSDSSRTLIRPSGTEPKIKIYILVCGKTENDSAEKVENIYRNITEILK